MGVDGRCDGLGGVNQSFFHVYRYPCFPPGPPSPLLFIEACQVSLDSEQRWNNSCALSEGDNIHLVAESGQSRVDVCIQDFVILTSMIAVCRQMTWHASSNITELPCSLCKGSGGQHFVLSSFFHAWCAREECWAPRRPSWGASPPA